MRIAANIVEDREIGQELLQGDSVFLCFGACVCAESLILASRVGQEHVCVFESACAC